MADEAPKVGSGNVQIELLDASGNPETFTLVPTYSAARTISGTSGGLLGAIERVAKLDVDAVVQVIQLGLSQGQQQRGPQDLAERVWRTGLTDDTGGVANTCIEYLRVLMRGGRPTPSEGEPKN